MGKSSATLVHGHDVDSICSAAIIYKLLQKLKIDTSNVVTESNYSFGIKDFEKVKKVDHKFVVILDIPVVGVDVLTQLTKFYKVMIIDHHKPKGYVRVCYINPRIYDDTIYAPTTYIAYKIYESFLNPKDILWIACIGVLGDHGVESCKDIFIKLRKMNPDLFGNSEITSESLFRNSKLGMLTRMIDAGRVIDVKNVDKVFKIITTAKSYKDVERNSFIRKLFKSLELEFEKNLKEFEKNKKVFKSVVFYEIKSKYNLKSSFAGYVQTLFEDKVICVAQKFGEYYEVSLRKGEKLNVDLSKLAETLIEGLKDASGGGHPSASAVRFPSNEIKNFINKLEKIKF
jgi:single-stranded DNA-specific DHH superfamily exonuclease